AVAFLFLRAEDGIRDRNVTGVQTCALPISTFAIFFSRQGLIFPLFVLSISTLDFSSELMLLLLHIINTETPYVNLFLCGNLNNNIGYFSVQGFLKVH